MAAREPGGASRDWPERGPVSAGMHKLLPESNNERHRRFPALPAIEMSASARCRWPPKKLDELHCIKPQEI